MLYQWYETGIMTYLLVAIGGIGVLSKLLLGYGLSVGLRNTELVAYSDKKWLRQMQQEYADCCTRYGKVNNVDIFVDKHLGSCRYFGIRLSTWKRIGGQVILLAAGIIVFTLAEGILYRQDVMRIMFEFFVGSWLVLINLVVDNLTNAEEKELQMRVNLLEFFENHPLSEQAAEQPDEKKAEQSNGEASEGEKEPDEEIVVLKAAEADRCENEEQTTDEKAEEKKIDSEPKPESRRERNRKIKAAMSRKEQLKEQLIAERKEKRVAILQEVKEARGREDEQEKERMQQEAKQLALELAAAVECAEEESAAEKLEKEKEKNALLAEVLKEFLAL
ncbi:MAG: hypothetical protein IJY09_00545 [Lachnospiraceae bacterium]|nr:hypothetical protein [Lachnospiraceae bacterium]